MGSNTEKLTETKITTGNEVMSNNFRKIGRAIALLGAIEESILFLFYPKQWLN